MTAAAYSRGVGSRGDAGGTVNIGYIPDETDQRNTGSHSFLGLVITGDTIYLPDKDVRIKVKNLLYCQQQDSILTLTHYAPEKTKVYHEILDAGKADTAQDLTHKVNKLVGVPRKRKVFAFVNPASGTGKGVTIFERTVHPMLQRTGYIVGFQVTEKEGPRSIEQLMKSIDLSLYEALVVVGGDSTVRDVINALWVSQGYPSNGLKMPPIAVIPAGSGNAQAKTFHSPKDPEVAVAAMVLGGLYSSPVLKIQNGQLAQLAVCNAGYGSSADTIAEADQHQWKGIKKYLLGSIYATVNHCERFEADVSITRSDGKEEKVRNIFRDIMLRTAAVSNPVDEPGSGASVMTMDGNSGKMDFFLSYLRAIPRIAKREPAGEPCIVTKGCMTFFSGNVSKCSLALSRQNDRHFSDSICIDGDLYPIDVSQPIHVSYLNNVFDSFALHSQHTITQL